MSSPRENKDDLSDLISILKKNQKEALERYKSKKVGGSAGRENFLDYYAAQWIKDELETKKNLDSYEKTIDYYITSWMTKYKLVGNNEFKTSKQYQNAINDPSEKDHVWIKYLHDTKKYLELYRLQRELKTSAKDKAIEGIKEKIQEFKDEIKGRIIKRDVGMFGKKFKKVPDDATMVKLVEAEFREPPPTMRQSNRIRLQLLHELETHVLLLEDQAKTLTAEKASFDSADKKASSRPGAT